MIVHYATDIVKDLDHAIAVAAEDGRKIVRFDLNDLESRSFQGRISELVEAGKVTIVSTYAVFYYYKGIQIHMRSAAR